MISRRKFIKYSALASTSLLIPNFLRNLQAGELKLQRSISGKKLIIVQLSGGNDGLNTVVPFKNDIYYASRPLLSIEEKKVLKINDELGFNPVMEKLKKIYDNGNLSIINSVGYPNPDRSHFRSTDIWHTASSSDKYLNTGWIGRYLDSECESCKNPYSAIEVDSELNLAMKGNKRSGIAVNDPQKFYMNSSERFLMDLSGSVKLSENDYSDISYLYKTLVDTTSSADYIYQNSKIYKSKLTYPNTQFGKNLKTIVELILSGIDTSVYYVSMSGFDTHVNQKGRQERLLKEFSEGISSIIEELRMNNKLNEVLFLTFSEFGRRVSQNGSAGTDHGTANNLFLITGDLKIPGFYNSQPDLSNLNSGDLIYEIDFRRIYATVLNKWLEADDGSILGNKFDYLNVI